MKNLKVFLVCAVVTYSIFFLGDYISMRRHGSKESCAHWMKTVPVWFHLLMPGPGNACIDKGWWP